MKMIRPIALLLMPVLAAVLVLGMADFADAKRFGGGRSFGSKPMFSKSYSKPVQKAPLNQNKSTATQTQQPRKGLFGGMGGMFGGLLAGTLLGSLLFGGGFGGIGFLDIILLVLAFFFLRKMFRSRRMETQQTAYQGGGHANYNQQSYAPPEDNYSTMQRQSHDAWSNLRSTPAGGSHAQDVQPEVTTPAGFDSEDFLKGAKMVFNRLQQSWDSRDLEDIKEFTTHEVFESIKQQAKEDPVPSRTEILMSNARLLEVKEEGDGILATVYFDVLMREDQSAQHPEQVREVWHFLKNHKDDSMWLLDGIQQLES
ncbi:Tim44 domain-containing protein [Halodesulfovibrio marinisediminis]|uniref:Predicted lipid-binding transport protein, Tim44 family n=1 Tax=Halodesulfovibrio marinisediminis DSM 17456 TaxID=1121457 RepID=A0A1N6H948_9BACT|nr:TIM44-like domain-containing protein [Halodesulfovibrio marinisediminis]SIO16239.1 Predicted lipid-binding transport protein, Tim44 family [Halodesulfovibrio marinisediminis DSM 17456]